MTGQPFDLIGGFYQDDSLTWTAQDTVNWIPEAAEAQGTRTPSMLRNAPGLRPYVQVGEGPIRGMRNVEGKLLVVSGNTLYQVSNAGVAIPRGTIPGTGLVSMSHNQRTGTNQCLIVNGAAGYVYDTSALTLTKITDPGYPGAFVVDFIDGYMAQVEPLRRYWFHSGLRDALDYNTLDRYEAEGQPDAIVSLLVDHREVWVFGERTIEPYVNAGTLTNTFQRASNTVIQYGCASKFSPAALDGSICWLDNLGIVRMARGYQAERISTGAIEKAISELDWKRAFGFTYTDNGHAIYYLTFPDGQTFGFDVVTRLWHRRESYGLNRWRVNCLAQWNGDWLAGDFRNGSLYTLDWHYPFEGSDPLVRERRTGVIHDNQNRVAVPYAELIIDNGRGPVAIVGAAPQPDGPSITGDAPSGIIDDGYSYAYAPTGGTAPLVVALAPGSSPLPTGLTLSSAGVLSGTPTALGDYTFTVRVTDANGLYDDLPDSVEVTEVTARWFAGPVEVSSDPAYYVAAASVLGLTMATPAALPAEGSGPLQRMSVANGLVFMHRDTTGCVSDDAGATWTACDNSLYGDSWQRDVFWNGTKYYYGGVTSSDGVTWTAIPNLPSGGRVQLARADDGLIVVQDAAGIFYTSIDAGANWVTAQDFGVSYSSSIGSDGDRISAASTNGFIYYSDDLIQTISGGDPGSAFGAYYANGAFFSYFDDATEEVIGLARSTDGATWPNTGGGGALPQFVVPGVDLNFMTLGHEIGGAMAACSTTASVSTLYGSLDSGVTWASVGTLDGTLASVVATNV